MRRERVNSQKSLAILPPFLVHPTVEWLGHSVCVNHGLSSRPTQVRQDGPLILSLGSHGH